MKQIYFDRDQCENFGVPYFNSGKISLRADVILASKAQGYDSSHREILKPLDSTIIQLSRERLDGPGWYTIWRS